MVCGGDAEVLGRVLEAGVPGAIRVRAWEPGWGRAVRRLLDSGMPVEWKSESGRPGVWEDDFAERISDGSPEVRESGRELGRDIEQLASGFSEIVGGVGVRVRLTRVEDAGCALFHVDSLSLRLLCSYWGPGVQWVPEEGAVREELGLCGRTIAEANAAIVPDPAQIRTVRAGSVLVLKGRRFGGEPGLIHRSAPPGGEPRLRLCIDVAGEGGGE